MQNNSSIVPLSILAAAAAPATLFTLIHLTAYAFTWPFDYQEPLEITGPWFMVFVVALFHAVGLGLPTYFLAKIFRLTYWWVSVIGGFLIGALPAAISGWPDPDSDYKVWNGKEMVDQVTVAGMSLHAGWIEYLIHVCEMGIYGISGGFAAWLVWRYLPYKK